MLTSMEPIGAESRPRDLVAFSWSRVFAWTAFGLAAFAVFGGISWWLNAAGAGWISLPSLLLSVCLVRILTAVRRSDAE
jgi:hypothetical protein